MYVIREKATKRILYPGSTNSFENRRRDHKYNTLNSNSSKHNRDMYQNLRNISNNNWDMFEVVPVDKCDPGYESIYETHLITMLKPNGQLLNSYMPRKIDLGGLSYIYKATDTRNSKVIYVGMTNDAQLRFYYHKRNCYNPNYDGYDKPLYKYTRNIDPEKWPEHIVFDVIEQCPSVIERIRENHYMNVYNIIDEVSTKTSHSSQLKSDAKTNV